MFTAPLIIIIIISIYDIQHLSTEQKRKQSVFSGSNDKLVFLLYSFSKTLHLHDFAHIFLKQYMCLIHVEYELLYIIMFV